MVDNRNDVEGDRTHVEKHAGDVEERSEQEDALAADEYGEDVPGESLQEGPTRRVEPSGLGPAVT